MERYRLKADGRIVGLDADGRELLPQQRSTALGYRRTAPDEVRNVRALTGLSQTAFAQRIEVPVDTIRNWEQGKRAPRGPARALLAVIAHSPETVFAALSTEAVPA